jgi:hypothetical protein
VRHGAGAKWVSLALAAGVLVGIALDVAVLRPEVGGTQPVFRGAEPPAAAEVPPEVAALPPEEWLQLVVDHIESGDVDGARKLLDAFHAAHPNYAPAAKP